MKKVQFPAQITQVASKVDKSLNVRLNTALEMNAESAGVLYGFANKMVYVGIAETEEEVNEIEIPDYLPEFQGEKSHSQRLKELLYVYWSKKIKDTKDVRSSDQFYRDQMERYITNVKDKLD